jgi:hypothetical protein
LQEGPNHFENTLYLVLGIIVLAILKFSCIWQISVSVGCGVGMIEIFYQSLMIFHLMLIYTYVLFRNKASVSFIQTISNRNI